MGRREWLAVKGCGLSKNATNFASVARGAVDAETLGMPCPVARPVTLSRRVACADCYNVTLVSVASSPIFSTARFCWILPAGLLRELAQEHLGSPRRMPFFVFPKANGGTVYAYALS